MREGFSHILHPYCEALIRIWEGITAMQIIKDYKHDDALRAQLNTLARESFSLVFEPWYQAGFWDERYIPYSIIEDGVVAANVSVNHVCVEYEANAYPAVMIGTVMTAKQYRGRGYARILMEAALEDCKRTAELAYLFANDSVLDFYPKFGFELAEEKQCFVLCKDALRKADTVNEQPCRLDISKPHDLAIVERLIQTGIPAPKRLLVPTIRSLVLFYCQSVYRGSVLYYPRRDLLVFYHDGELLDYYSAAPVELCEVIALIAPGKEELPLGFTPARPENMTLRYRTYDDNLFVTNPAWFTGDFMFPSLSRA